MRILNAPTKAERRAKNAHLRRDVRWHVMLAAESLENAVKSLEALDGLTMKELLEVNRQIAACEAAVKEIRKLAGLPEVGD